jgi:hypothetical protein
MDNYATGWGAWLDGQAAPVYIANHTFRAVVVHDGETVQVDLPRQSPRGLSYWLI